MYLKDLQWDNSDRRIAMRSRSGRGGKNGRGGMRAVSPARRALFGCLAGIAAVLLMTSSGFSQAVPPGGLPAAENLYVEAVIQIEAARQQSAKGARDEALSQLAGVVYTLERIRAEYPNWKSGMVDYRIDQSKKEIERIRNGVSVPMPPATVPAAVPVAIPVSSGAPAKDMPQGASLPVPRAEPVLLSVPEPLAGGMRVLILSDSMGIGGFAKELDTRFRSMPGVESVHTIMACGTNPLTWMKSAPYTNAKTRCGYYSIESVPGESTPRVVRDVYGIPRGNKPGSHRVPKIEDLVARIRPQIVVFQNGNNFFSCFRDRKTIAAKSHGKLIRAHVAPLVKWLTENGSSIRKFYWVTPPQAGCVTAEIQQFVFDAIGREMAGVGIPVDSRKVTRYPYKVQAPDKEHFWGNESIAWGKEVFGIVERDLAALPLESTPMLTTRKRMNIASASPDSRIAGSPVSLKLRAVMGTPVPPPRSFAPYGEFLVGHLYEVESVTTGAYTADRLLLFHPAFIGKELQQVPLMEAGTDYEFTVLPLNETSPWATVGQEDATGSFDLVPHMLVSDLARHPDSKKADDCCEVSREGSDSNNGDDEKTARIP